VSSDGKTGFPDSRYRLWNDLPLKRRRLFGWLVAWWVLGGLVHIPLRLIGLSQPLVAIVVVALIAATVIPLGWAAWQELQQRRANGEEAPPAPVRGRSVVGWAVVTAALWGLYVVVLPAADGPAIPVLPILATVTAVMRFRRWRQQKAITTAGD
jgi:hypothetical protein